MPFSHWIAVGEEAALSSHASSGFKTKKKGRIAPFRTFAIKYFGSNSKVAHVSYYTPSARATVIIFVVVSLLFGREPRRPMSASEGESGSGGEVIALSCRQRERTSRVATCIQSNGTIATQLLRKKLIALQYVYMYVACDHEAGQA